MMVLVVMLMATMKSTHDVTSEANTYKSEFLR